MATSVVVPGCGSGCGRRQVADDRHRHDGQQSGGHDPALLVMLGQHGRDAAQHRHQREGAHAGHPAGGVLALQADQQAQQDGDAQLLKSRFHQGILAYSRLGGNSTSPNRQSQMGTGSVASMNTRVQERPPATVPVPFCDGPPACRGKRGTGTVAMTFPPILSRSAPRSQSPFFQSPARIGLREPPDGVRMVECRKSGRKRTYIQHAEAFIKIVPAVAADQNAARGAVEAARGTAGCHRGAGGLSRRGPSAARTREVDDGATAAGPGGRRLGPGGVSAVDRAEGVEGHATLPRPTRAAIRFRQATSTSPSANRRHPADWRDEPSGVGALAVAAVMAIWWLTPLAPVRVQQKVANAPTVSAGQRRPTGIDRGQRGEAHAVRSGSVLLTLRVRSGPHFSPVGEDRRQCDCLAGELVRRVCPVNPRPQHGEQVRRLLTLR